MTEGGSALLAFSTLACPEWDAETVIRRAADMGYRGVEWRGGPDGTVDVAWSAIRRAAVRSAMSEAGIAAVAVTAYSELISGDLAIRSRSVDALVRHAELARDLGAPAVRVFLGVADDNAPPAELERRAIEALAIALTRADTTVTLAIEPHDDHVLSGSVAPILRALHEERLGVVWDIANAWSGGEAPETGLAAYGGRIAYVQVKDGVGRGTSWRFTGLGDGEVPLGRALAALRASQRAARLPMPPISVEWERAWHPELAPADEALPAARRWLADTLAGLDVAGAASSGGAA
ncbi:MAG TPA: sugar phosphate isomerase/epimerase family protein [Patescibacteria group bacterium]|nr:sugar phosphate isomerase/epimerase family protein [Patescibacteria group bacterium]